MWRDKKGILEKNESNKKEGCIGAIQKDIF